MKNKWLIALGVVVVVLVAGLAGCAGDISGNPSALELRMNNQQEGIWVNGEGKVPAVPDVANLSLGITAKADTVAQAQSQASEAMNKVMKALTDNGVASKDIKTQQFNISKVTRWDDKNQQEVVLGYQVTNTVTAKVRDIPKTGTVIDAVAVAGGDLTRIDSISFSIDNPTPYQQQAREKAMADAKSKAEQMAKLAGVSLGKPTYISESSYIPGPIYRADLVKAEGAPVPAPAPTPISAGEQQVTVTVQIVYNIK
jgi:uncharacterized protein YggE